MRAVALSIPLYLKKKIYREFYLKTNEKPKPLYFLRAVCCYLSLFSG